MRGFAAILALMLAASCGDAPLGVQPSPAPAADAEEGTDVVELAEAALEDAQQQDPSTDAQTTAAAPPASARQNQDLFASLFGAKPKPVKARPTEVPSGVEDGQAVVIQAALAQPDTAKQTAQSEIAYGARLPYGTIKRICGLTKRQMGKKIAQYPERRPVHVLYDSDPKSTEPRSFYLTGFGDGCARQFTAALAVFGSVGMHELLRYGLPAEVQPYSDTDKAYERLKRKVCGKPKRKPCGSKISLLEKDTVFLSVYERFEGNAQWINLLLHRGKMVAHDKKKGGES